MCEPTPASPAPSPEHSRPEGWYCCRDNHWNKEKWNFCRGCWEKRHRPRKKKED